MAYILINHPSDESHSFALYCLIVERCASGGIAIFHWNEEFEDYDLLKEQQPEEEDTQA